MKFVYVMAASLFMFIIMVFESSCVSTAEELNQSNDSSGLSIETKNNLTKIVKTAINSNTKIAKPGSPVKIKAAEDLTIVETSDKSFEKLKEVKIDDNGIPSIRLLSCGSSQERNYMQNVFGQKLVEFNHNYTYCHPQSGVTEITANSAKTILYNGNMHDSDTHCAVDIPSAAQKNVRARFRGYSDLPLLQWVGIDITVSQWNIVHEDDRGTNGRISERWYQD
ncbi:MAG: hypothetical protein LBM13_05075 [Candidatus Ancillula sp.]|jgi:hypothetical protein|nr:hypothetical protein [Candidatus Ancillula sp.]